MASSQTAPPEGSRTSLRADVAIGLAAFALLALAYLWTPIRLHATHTFAGLDMVSQRSTLTHVDAAPYANDLLLDPARQMHPWELFDRDELAAGRWPLWNPYDGAGVPHLANYQSAVFSPFSVPFYVLDFKTALIVAAFAKLTCLGLFTFLLLRELGLSRPAALVGAIAFAYSGFHLLCLQHGHVGVMAALPATLWFAERWLAAAEVGRGARLGSLAGVTVALACAALAGHPETLAVCALVVLAYCAARACGLWLTHRDDPVLRARVVARTAALGLAAVLAIGLAAVQLAPFFEYLQRSAAFATERDNSALVRANWPLALFPNLAGTPLDAAYWPDRPAPNYQEFNSFHVGGLVIFLALAGAWRAVRDQRIAFFAIVCLAWLEYAWDLLHLSALGINPSLLSLIPIPRTHPLWTLPICIVAAAGLDRIASAGTTRGLARAALVLGGAALFVLVFRIGAANYLSELATVEGYAAIANQIAAHVASITLVLGLGACALATLIAARSRPLRALGWSVIVIAVAAESAWTFRDYVPTLPDRYSYPHTPAIDALCREVGDELLVVLARDSIESDANMVYGLRMLPSYDALAIADQQRLVTHYFGSDWWTLLARRKGLDLYGVRYVATMTPWVPIDTALGEVSLGNRVTPYFEPEALIGQAQTLAEVLPGAPMTIELKPARDGLDGLCLWFVEGHGHRALATLRESASGRVLERLEFALEELPAPDAGRRELVLDFEHQPSSSQLAYELELDALDGAAGDALRVCEARQQASIDGLARLEQRASGERDRRARNRPVEQRVGARVGDRKLATEPALDLAFGRSDFQLVARCGQHYLFRYRPSRGRAWIVHRVQRAASHEDAWEQVVGDSFDPTVAVVLEDDVPQLPQTAPTDNDALILEPRTPAAWHAHTSSSQPGVCVLAQPFFPGWKATIDGREQPLHRANYALTALELPSGTHEIEIWFAPVSFRAGAAVSIASLALGLIALLAARRRSRVRHVFPA